MAASLPCPFVPQASSPASGSIIVTLRLLRTATLSCVAMFCHMFVFMAGAMATGPGKARICADSMSDDCPCAMRAIREADAGQTSRAWQFCPGSRCAKGSESAKSSV